MDSFGEEVDVHCQHHALSDSVVLVGVECRIVEKSA